MRSSDAGGDSCCRVYLSIRSWSGIVGAIGTSPVEKVPTSAPAGCRSDS
jgi:hypothetical protein